MKQHKHIKSHEVAKSHEKSLAKRASTVLAIGFVSVAAVLGANNLVRSQGTYNKHKMPAAGSASPFKQVIVGPGETATSELLAAYPGENPEDNMPLIKDQVVDINRIPVDTVIRLPLDAHIGVVQRPAESGNDVAAE